MFVYLLKGQLQSNKKRILTSVNFQLYYIPFSKFKEKELSGSSLQNLQGRVISNPAFKFKQLPHFPDNEAPNHPNIKKDHCCPN